MMTVTICFVIPLIEMETELIHTRTVRTCDFDFLTEWFYPVFRKTIFTGQYLDQSLRHLGNMPATSGNKPHY